MSADHRWVLDALMEPAGDLTLGVHRDGTRLTVAISGDIDVANAPVLGTHLHELIAAGDVREVVMDLARVGFCDAAGLRVLLAAQQSAIERDADCRFVRLSPAVLCLLGLIDREDIPTSNEWREMHNL